MVQAPLKGVRVTSDDGTVYADDQGAYDTGGSATPATVRLRSETVRVQFGPGANASLETDGGPVIFGEPDAAPGEVSTFVWLTESLERYEELWPESPWFELDGTVVVGNLDSDLTCNAFYFLDGLNGDITLGREGDGCANAATIETIVHHEFGHGVTLFSRVVDGFIDEPDGHVGEGASDYWACAMTDQADVTPGWSDDPKRLRRCDEQVVWPADREHDYHRDGRMLSSALWSLREQLIARDGPDGAELADDLYMGMLPGIRGIPSAFEEMQVYDDDNGDLSDGTPNTCEMLRAFVPRGLGPETGSTSFYVHVPVEGEVAADTPIDVQIEALHLAACDEIATASLEWRTADDDGTLDLEQSGDLLTGSIPGAADVDLEYRWTVESSAGEETSEWFVFTVLPAETSKASKGDDKKGCGCGSPGPLSWTWPLLLLGWRRRPVRR